MPSSKQVRARQNRQRERIAVAHAERAQKRKRNLIVGWTVGVLVVVLGVGALIIFLPSDSSSQSAAPPTTTPPTTAKALPSAAGKNCVARKGALPKGAPDVPVQTGPPPKTLVIKDLKVGTGAVIKKTDTITTNYIGVACSTGEIFDSSYSRGQPSSFPLNGVIPGWTQGIPGMRVGGVRLLGIPAALAYGAQGQPPSIAPDEALWFVVAPTKIG